MIRFRDSIYSSIHKMRYSQEEKTLSITDSPGAPHDTFNEVDREEYEKFCKIMQVMYKDVGGPQLEEPETFGPIIFKRKKSQTS